MASRPTRAAEISPATEHLLKVLEAVTDVLHWQKEDEEHIGMIHRLLDNDAAGTGDDARHHSSPSLPLVRERPTLRSHGGRHRR